MVAIETTHQQWQTGIEQCLGLRWAVCGGGGKERRRRWREGEMEGGGDGGRRRWREEEMKGGGNGGKRRWREEKMEGGGNGGRRRVREEEGEGGGVEGGGDGGRRRRREEEMEGGGDGGRRRVREEEEERREIEVSASLTLRSPSLSHWSQLTLFPHTQQLLPLECSPPGTPVGKGLKTTDSLHQYPAMTEAYNVDKQPNTDRQTDRQTNRRTDKRDIDTIRQTDRYDRLIH